MSNTASRFFNAETWVLDLDNTLYPHDRAIFSQMDAKMGRFVADFLGVDLVEARTIQKKYLMEFGTTLNGLMHHHGLEPQSYLEYVHDIDLTPIKNNPSLRASLLKLPGRKIIFTNADTAYAKRVIKRIGIDDLIDDTFDIQAANLIPKPRKAVYDTLVRTCDFDPKNAVLVEDMARNLIPAKEKGMATVWVNTGSVWGRNGHDPSQIDVEITKLTEWLEQITRDNPLT